MDVLQAFFVTIVLVLFSNIYAFGSSDMEFDSQKNDIFAAIKKDENLKPHFTYESSISNFVSEDQCIRINHNLHKGERQKSKRAFKWVIDVPTKGKISSKEAIGIKELNALVTVKLLSKKTVYIDIDSIKQKFNRYRLTVKGWKESVGRDCFYLGKAKHLSVTKVKKIQVPISRDSKETLYKVTTIVGIAREQKLPDWANHQDVRQAFPLVDKLVKGYERIISMNKVNGQWAEYLSPSSVKRMAKSGRTKSSNYFNTNASITKKESMLDAFEIEEHRNKYWSCISLPGQSSNGVRVDKELKSSSQYNYSVAIFDNMKRSKLDDIEIKTKPYLERLVGAGLLTSHLQNGIEGNKKNRGKLFNGTVYQLSSNYNHIIDKNKGCIYLGKGKVNLVELKIIASNARGNHSLQEIVKYKYIMTYPEPPEWVKDPVLQSQWSDLKGALDYGLACDGTFEIDLTEERKMGAGSGSCWWAYDSVAEL
ncbi:hypothetical protein [Shewanella frigidimarina]|uniref:Uncharacterized protein n=1 Tax=Shewanella frigidimarina (strain NCIMB 400) TaxID=318167 RepID=Q07YR1_SHEFN|nr:hypothetical protein [Shewanella frigidimarina]ABI72853.1 hypothetical protein Sfri_3015 [Shewanella frigidimarina NCIMB 400]